MITARASGGAVVSTQATFRAPAGRSALKFFVGLHQPGDACHFDRACISINHLRRRRKPVDCPEVLLDSGAFTELAMHGRYRRSVDDYAAEIRRLHDARIVRIGAAVAQDYMCEPWMLAKTACRSGTTSA